MAHDAGVVRISGVSVGHGWIAFPAGSDETSPVTTRRHLAIGNLNILTLVAAGRVILIANDTAAILEVVFVLHLALVTVVIHVANVEKDLLTIGVFGHRKHGVRRLSLVAPLKTASDGHGANGVRLIIIQCPSCDIELMGALVVKISITRSPEPVPIVVHVVVVKLMDDSRPAPKVPVDIGWGR